MQDSPATSPDLTSPAPACPTNTEENVPRKPGRPPVLGTNQKKRIITLLTAGCSRRTAAKSVGCAPTTIINTMKRDAEFAKEVVFAETNLEADLLEAVRSAAKVHRYWRAASWLLERKNPREYVARAPNLYTLNQVADQVNVVMSTLQEDLTREQCDRVVKKLDAILALDPGNPA